MRPQRYHAIWILLTILSVLLGSASVVLLKVESDRIRGISDRLLQERETATMEAMAILVSEIESGLMDSLSSFPEAGLEENLQNWSAGNPFVERALLWPPGQALQHFPSEPVAWRGELEAWLARAVSSADPPGAEVVGVAPSAVATPWQHQEDLAAPEEAETSRFLVTRQRVRDVTKEAYFEQRALEVQDRQAAPSAPSGARPTATAMEMEPLARSVPEATAAPFLVAAPNGGARSERGWRWVDLSGQPQLVGWFRPFPGASLRGIVVDADHLYHTLVESLPVGEAGAKPLLQRDRASPRAAGGESALIRPLPDRIFPGVSLVLPRSGDDVFNRTFWLLASLLTAVLVITFFSGGSLLVWTARRAAEDALRKTDFLSNVSHELKTPLTTLRLYAELLETGRVEAGEKQRRYLRTIHAETRRLTRLVNNILHFSALQKGVSRLNLRPLNLAQLAEEVCDQQEVRMQEAGLELRRCNAVVDALIRGDPDALEQCLINLIDNAIKYGGPEPQVTCRLTVEGKRVLLAVEDAGPGVPREQRHRIFEAFHRVDDSLTTAQPGSGLGLSITQSLVTQMGGSIRYEPNHPTGARFVLDFPRLEGGEEPTTHGAQQP